MLTLAVVLVAAVVEVEAQGHGAPAPAAHAPKADPHAKADPPAKADPHAKPAPPAKADPHAKAAPESKPAGKAAAPASPPDLGTVLERINKQVGTIVTDMNRSSPPRQAVPADHAVKSPAPRGPSRGRAAATTASTHPRVELDWHTPLLVWPEELVRP